MSSVVEIYIAEKAGSPMLASEQIQLERSKGIIGDRYASECGTFSEKLAGLPDKEITLIESEMVTAFNIEQGFQYQAADFRRNLVTEGVRLNELVGKEFSVGNVRLKGIRLCEPCAHLAGVLTQAILPALVHKAGLRAQIIIDGEIRKNDSLCSQ
jgi:MOSC domain-containing protein YiiM